MRRALLLSCFIAMASASCRVLPTADAGLTILPTRAGQWPDECAPIDDFAAYRERLKMAVAKRDVARLMPLLSDDILSSFGGDAGKEDFRRHWNLERPAETRLWSQLGTVLALGCQLWGERTVVMPAYIAMLPSEVDAPSVVVALRPTQVHAEASAASRPLVRLPLGAVVPFVLGQTLEEEFTEVEVGSRKGWVRTSDVRMALDYRAAFEPVMGEWKLKSFAAGD